MGNSRIRIAITMGDPAGVGPEIIVKALAHHEIYKKCIPIVVGDYAVLTDVLRFCGPGLRLHEIKEVEEAEGKRGIIDFINIGYMTPGSWRYGENCALCGNASFSCIIKAIEMAGSGKVAAVVTAPVSKEALNMAGHQYSGHTEIFAEYTKTRDFAMLLASDNLRVIHVSTHCALREACDKVKKERVLEVIRLAASGTRLLGIPDARIAVAGLNPHCSENGLFGKEEREEIIPAIEAAKSEGYRVDGPFPPDTVFAKCMAGFYDIVVAMYHDQGHIPLKLNSFQFETINGRNASFRGINCTIGLPIIRTSVDHGTAFGKAGEGRANEESMMEAIYAGITMAENRRK